MENGSCITLTSLWVTPKSGSSCAVTWVSLTKPMEQLTAVAAFPHAFPVGFQLQLLCVRPFRGQPFPSFLPPSGAPSCVWSQTLLQSACSLHQHSVLFDPWLHFSCLNSVSPHLESQLHSFTPQSAAPGCDSFRLFAPVLLHESSPCILLWNSSWTWGLSQKGKLSGNRDEWTSILTFYFTFI